MEARLQAAIRVNPNLASLHASLGELYRSQARLPEAREAFGQAVRLEPMNPAFRAQLGRTHLALDEFTEAEINFSWGTELAPQDPEMHAGLGEALIGLGRGADAIVVLERAAGLDPGNAEVERLLALARSGADEAEAGAPAASAIGLIVRAMTVFFGILLTIAGLGLLLPVASAVVVLVLLLPRALLQRRKA